jgi:hypothetical protein
MNGLFLHRLVPVALCAMVASAAGQPSAPAGRLPDPTDARAAVPPARYESSLTRQPPRGDEGSVAWREANDAAARIGGWRAYARMAQPPAAAASAASLPVSPGAHNGHAGPGPHGGHAGHQKP